MAGYPVTGDEYRDIDRRMSEIKRQLNQPDGSPLDPAQVLRALQGIVEGDFDYVPVGRKVIISCDAAPYIPNGWKIEEHRKGGEIEFDLARIALHLDEGQKNGQSIIGNDLRRRLADMPVLNAKVLDHLLANTNLIPEAWKGKCVFFWGTIYRGGDGNLCVRYLYWGGGQWDWSFSWLDSQWDDECPAVISAS